MKTSSKKDKLLNKKPTYKTIVVNKDNINSFVIPEYQKKIRKKKISSILKSLEV